MGNDLLGYELEDWWPASPLLGPPLPRWMGVYWPWYKPPAAEFRVSDFVISPSEVRVGEPVVISCTVTNVGTETGTYTVVCEVT